MSVWVLVIFFAGASDSGREVNTSLQFPAAQMCEVAKTVLASEYKLKRPMSDQPVMACVQVQS